MFFENHIFKYQYSFGLWVGWKIFSLLTYYKENIQLYLIYLFYNYQLRYINKTKLNIISVLIEYELFY